MFFEGFLSGCGFNVSFLCPLISSSLSLCVSRRVRWGEYKNLISCFLTAGVCYQSSVLNPIIVATSASWRKKYYFLVTEQIASVQSGANILYEWKWGKWLVIYVKNEYLQVWRFGSIDLACLILRLRISWAFWSDSSQESSFAKEHHIMLELIFPTHPCYSILAIHCTWKCFNISFILIRWCNYRIISAGWIVNSSLPPRFTTQQIKISFLSVSPSLYQTSLCWLHQSLWFQPVARATSLPHRLWEACASCRSCAWCAWTAVEAPGSFWDL